MKLWLKWFAEFCVMIPVSIFVGYSSIKAVDYLEYLWTCKHYYWQLCMFGIFCLSAVLAIPMAILERNEL